MKIGVNQTSSPIKFCFLIEPKSEEKFERALRICFSYWGGIYFPILQLFKELPHLYRQEYGIALDTQEYYTNTINNYDPDIILHDNSLEIEFLKKVVGDRTLVTIEKFLFDIKNEVNNYGINISHLIGDVITKEFKFKRNDEVKLQIPNTQDSSLFLKAFLGCIIEDFQQQVNKELELESYFISPKISFDNIIEFYPTENITILEIIGQKIRSIPERHWYKGESIYFLNDNRLNDILNYWNLRALGWNIIPIPISQIENKYFSEFIERFVYHQLNKTQDLTLITYQVSITCTKEQKALIANKLRLVQEKIKGSFQFVFQGWFPRFWDERAILEADKVLCGKIQVDWVYSQVEINENLVQIKITDVPFKLTSDYHIIASHKVNLEFSYFDEYVENAGLIYGIETIDWIRLTHTFGGVDRWRLSNTGLSYFVRRDNDEVFFYIPKAKDYFKIYFSKKENKLIETPNGRLANEVLKNIGGIRGTHFLQNKSSLNILELVENGKIVNYSLLIGEIKRNLNINDNLYVQSYIKTLLENKIIEFGAAIQCDVCQQRTFYLSNELNDRMTCSICRNRFDLPMNKPSEIKWSYRGIGPFSKNNKVGGIMSVFLTLKLFGEEFSDTSRNMSALIGFELAKKGSVKEVDLALIVQEGDKDNIAPDLVFCECKTFKLFTKEDADRMIELGNEFPNSILVFSTLNDDLQKEEKDEITRVVNIFRKGVGKRPLNPVLILTANELLPKSLFRHFNEYEENAKPILRYNDWLGNICQLSVKKHLDLKTWGEIREELWQKEMKKLNKNK